MLNDVDKDVDSLCVSYGNGFHVETWGITIGGVFYKEGTPEYWEAIKAAEKETKNA